SRTTAVGLDSPRSTSEIIDRLTRHFEARASRLRPSSARRPRTRAAIRALMARGAADGAASLIVDTVSTMMDRLATASGRRARDGERCSGYLDFGLGAKSAHQPSGLILPSTTLQPSGGTKCRHTEHF